MAREREQRKAERAARTRKTHPHIDAYDRLPALEFITGRPSNKPSRQEKRKARRAWWKRYREYQKSAAWKELREGMLKDAQYQCTECGSGGRLHVHHLTYARMGNEQKSDLQVLCEPCHQKKHPGKRIRLPRRKKTQENA